MTVSDPLLGVIVGSVITGAVTLAVSTVQYRAQNRRELMSRRQKWIEEVLECIPEIISTAGWFYLSKMKDPSPSGSAEETWNPEKTSYTLKLAQKIARVELMLDRGNDTHVALIQSMHEVRDTAFASGSRLIQFEAATEQLKDACLAVLKQKLDAS